jgi:hypothetical protein
VRLDLERDSATEFPDISNPGDVNAARIWFCKYRTLEPLSNLTSLSALTIAGYPDSSFDWISALARLTYLKIVHLPKVTDLTPLGRLDFLRTLSLATLPSWDSSRKQTLVKSLEPLMGLRELKHIELFSVVPPDKSLEALERLPSLETARVQGFPKKEISRFFADTTVRNEFAPDPEL